MAYLQVQIGSRGSLRGARAVASSSLREVPLDGAAIARENLDKSPHRKIYRQIAKELLCQILLFSSLTSTSLPSSSTTWPPFSFLEFKSAKGDVLTTN